MFLIATSYATCTRRNEYAVKLLVKFLKSFVKSTIQIIFHISITPHTEATFEYIPFFVNKKCILFNRLMTITSSKRIVGSVGKFTPTNWHNGSVSGFRRQGNMIIHSSFFDIFFCLINILVRMPFVFGYCNPKFILV